MPFSVPESHSESKTRLSCHVSLSSPWCEVSQTCLVSWWLWQFWEILVRYFVKCLSIGIVFSWLVEAMYFFFLKTIRYLSYTKSAFCQYNSSLLRLTSTTWLDVMFGFPTADSPFIILPLIVCTLWKKVTMHSSLLRRQSCAALPWGRSICFLEYFYVRYLLIHPPIYLHKHLFSSLWIFGYLLIKIGLYNPVLPYLFCCSNCFSVGHKEPLQLSPLPFRNTLSLVIFIYFWTLYSTTDTTDLSCAFSALDLELAILPQSPASCYWIN